MAVKKKKAPKQTKLTVDLRLEVTLTDDSPFWLMRADEALGEYCAKHLATFHGMGDYVTLNSTAGAKMAAATLSLMRLAQEGNRNRG